MFVGTEGWHSEDYSADKITYRHRIERSLWGPDQMKVYFGGKKKNGRFDQVPGPPAIGEVKA
jgi:hypothetical protein